jgi:hypothetical protein
MKSKSEFKRVAIMNPMAAAEEWFKLKEENQKLKDQLDDLLQSSHINAAQMVCAETSFLESDLAIAHNGINDCINALKFSQLAISRLHGDGQGGLVCCLGSCGICGVFYDNAKVIGKWRQK